MSVREFVWSVVSKSSIKDVQIVIVWKNNSSESEENKDKRGLETFWQCTIRGGIWFVFRFPSKAFWQCTILLQNIIRYYFKHRVTIFLNNSIQFLKKCGENSSLPNRLQYRSHLRKITRLNEQNNIDLIWYEKLVIKLISKSKFYKNRSQQKIIKKSPRLALSCCTHDFRQSKIVR